MSVAAQVDPHDKMRARDVNKVARGEQAPRPAHDSPKVSSPPSLRSTDPVTPNKGIRNSDTSTLARHCYQSYLDFHLCVKQKGRNVADCDKLESHYKSLCPNEWIVRWDKDRELGVFPGLS